MPGDVGLVAKLLDSLLDFVVSEDKLPEIRKRRQLRAKKEEARRALIDNDLPALRARIDELERLSNQP